MDENEIKQRDRPALSESLCRLWRRWESGVLLVAGAAAVTVGAALIYLPAGWITGGVLAILGGIFSAMGGDSE